MNPFRERIEQLLKDGKISPEEANKLIKAMESQGEPVSTSTPLTGHNPPPPMPQPAQQSPPQPPAPPPVQAPPPPPPKPAAVTGPKVSTGTVKKLSIDISAGDIKVRGVSGTSIIKSSSEIELKQEGEHVSITSNAQIKNPTEMKWLDAVLNTIGKVMPVKVEVEVPENLQFLEIEALAGDVDVRGIKGRVELSLAAGDLDLHDATSFKIDLKAGDAKIKTTLRDGQSSINALAGDVGIELDASSSVSLNASTSAGRASAKGFVLTGGEKSMVGGKLEGRLGGGNAKLEAKLMAGDLEIIAPGGETT